MKLLLLTFFLVLHSSQSFSASVSSSETICEDEFISHSEPPRSSSFIDDPITIYLNDLHTKKSAILSFDEEKKITKKISSAYKKMINLMLSIPHIQDLIINAYLLVYNKKIGILNYSKLARNAHISKSKETSMAYNLNLLSKNKNKLLDLQHESKFLRMAFSLAKTQKEQEDIKSKLDAVTKEIKDILMIVEPKTFWIFGTINWNDIKSALINDTTSSLEDLDKGLFDDQSFNFIVRLNTLIKFKKVDLIGENIEEFKAKLQKIKKILDDYLDNRKKMIEHNLRLVVAISKKFSRSAQDFSDIIQEGNTGLMVAIDNFDPTKGYKFSTFASDWIKQAIYKWLSQNEKIISIPPHLNNKIKKIKLFIQDYFCKYGKLPEKTLIADTVKINVELLDHIFAIWHITSLSEKINETSNDDNLLLGDIINMDADNRTNYKTPLNIDDIFRLDDISKAYNILTPQEQVIMDLRFGVNFRNIPQNHPLEILINKSHISPPATLKQISLIFELTRERIRQIEEKAIEKIQYFIQSKYMDGFSN